MAAYSDDSENPTDLNGNADRLRETILSAYNEILESPDATVEERRHILDSICRLTGINVGRDENEEVSAQEHAIKINAFLAAAEEATAGDADKDEKQNSA